MSLRYVTFSKVWRRHWKGGVQGLAGDGLQAESEGHGDIETRVRPCQSVQTPALPPQWMWGARAWLWGLSAGLAS